MDKSKLKNLIIILLVFVNLFLLVLAVSGIAQKNSAEKKRISALQAVLDEQGITLSDVSDLDVTCPDVIELERSVNKEKKMLSALIGSCTAEDLGGNIYIFSSEDGQARMRSTGDFEIALDTDVIPTDGDLISASETALRKLGISYDKDSLVIGQSNELDCVTATCKYNGFTVLNANITLYFSDSRLVLITGRRPPDVKDSSSDADSDLDAIAIILTFLENNHESGQVCSAILNVSTAYILDSATVGDCTLTPVWCIETDVGSFYFDGITGKARTVES